MTNDKGEQVDVPVANRKARQGAWLITFGALASVGVVVVIAWVAVTLIQIGEGNRELLEFVAEVSSDESQRAANDELANTLTIVLEREACGDRELMREFVREFVEAGVLPAGSETSFVCVDPPMLPGG